jgi:hypothetical protein
MSPSVAALACCRVIAVPRVEVLDSAPAKLSAPPPASTRRVLLPALTVPLLLLVTPAPVRVTAPPLLLTAPATFKLTESFRVNVPRVVDAPSLVMSLARPKIAVLLAPPVATFKVPAVIIPGEVWLMA